MKEKHIETIREHEKIKEWDKSHSFGCSSEYPKCPYCDRELYVDTADDNDGYVNGYCRACNKYSLVLYETTVVYSVSKQANPHDDDEFYIYDDYLEYLSSVKSYNARARAYNLDQERCRGYLAHASDHLKLIKEAEKNLLEVIEEGKALEEIRSNT